MSAAKSAATLSGADALQALSKLLQSCSNKSSISNNNSNNVENRILLLGSLHQLCWATRLLPSLIKQQKQQEQQQQLPQQQHPHFTFVLAVSSLDGEEGKASRRILMPDQVNESLDFE